MSDVSDRMHFVALLAALSSLGPFAMQSLAPALPMIGASFSVSPQAAQTMLSTSVLAIGVATLLLGPLSDHFGRRPVALWAVGVTAAASLLVAIAPTIESAVAARFVQAGAAGAGMVLGRAVARDRYDAAAAGGVIAQITAVMVVVPMVAPLIGGAVASVAGWRGVFVFTAFFAAAVWLWAKATMAESIVERAPTLSFAETWRSFRAVGAQRRFWAYCMVGVTSLSSFLFFVGTAPYVAAEGFGAGPEVYGLGFLFVGGGYMASNLAYARLSGRVRGDLLMIGGMIGAVASAGSVGVAVLLGWSGLETVFAAAVLNSLCAGLIVPNAMAGAVSAYPQRAGAASSLLGFAQFAFAALVTQLGAAIPHGDAAPMSLAMAGLSAAGLVGFLAIIGGRKPQS
jgi:DHA1 family bicyclomycin/chloramphenicol resistance-like MFS transporter